MNKECDSVRDKLPLYAENMLDDESRAEIEVHLEQCADCRAELERIKTPTAIEEQCNETEKRIKDAKSIKKTEKWIWVIAIPALVAKGILWLIGILLGLGIVGLIVLGFVGNVILPAYESVFQTERISTEERAYLKDEINALFDTYEEALGDNVENKSVEISRGTIGGVSTTKKLLECVSANVEYKLGDGTNITIGMQMWSYDGKLDIKYNRTYLSFNETDSNNLDIQTGLKDIEWLDEFLQIRFGGSDEYMKLINECHEAVLYDYNRGYGVDRNKNRVRASGGISYTEPSEGALSILLIEDSGGKNSIELFMYDHIFNQNEDALDYMELFLDDLFYEYDSALNGYIESHERTSVSSDYDFGGDVGHGDYEVFMQGDAKLDINIDMRTNAETNADKVATEEYSAVITIPHLVSEDAPKGFDGLEWLDEFASVYLESDVKISDEIARSFDEVLEEYNNSRKKKVSKEFDFTSPCEYSYKITITKDKIELRFDHKFELDIPEEYR